MPLCPQLALNLFLSSAGAVLPLTRAVYNSSAAWYQGAASASNRAVDRSIAQLGTQRDTLGNATGEAAGLLQDLLLRALVATAQGFTRGSATQAAVTP
jgi:hypothetical protein